MFHIGDRIAVINGQMKGKKGEVTDIEKAFLEVHEDGSFNRDGLMTLESTISSIQLPYTFDGETLTVEHPEHDFGSWIQKKYTRVAKFHQMAYTVRLDGDDHLTLLFEEQLQRI